MRIGRSRKEIWLYGRASLLKWFSPVRCLVQGSALDFSPGLEGWLKLGQERSQESGVELRFPPAQACFARRLAFDRHIGSEHLESYISVYEEL